jgi:transcriptional regulator with XRE-family HTH domain
MKDRIKTLRENIKVGSKAKNGKERHITQEAFAKALNLTQSTIAGYENGQLIPSDRTISDICRIYNVNEVWLRTGVGEMFRPRSREDEIAAFFGNVLSDRSPEVQRRLVSIMAKLPVEAWGFVEDLCQRVVDEWAAKEKSPAEGQGQE